MDNNILKYISRLDIDSISSLSDAFFDLVDSAIDGNTKFLVSTPEEYKEYLGIKDDLVLNPVYDDFTKKAIYRYIYEFQWLFAGILTNKQLVERINEGLKHRIETEDLSKEQIIDRISTNLYDTSSFDNTNEQLKYYGKPLDGYYNPITKAIYIDSNITSKTVDSVLFHELTHAITIKDYNKYPDLESCFLTETPVSFMQQKLEMKKYENNNRRVNTYITNHFKQLYIIFGIEILASYFENYRDISDLLKEFPLREKRDSKEILHNFVTLFESISKGVEYNGNPYKVEFANTTYELNMALLLSNYFKNHKELSDIEKLSKIHQMINVQKNPNFDIFKEIIKVHVKDISMLDYFPDLQFVMNPVKDHFSGIELLEDKYIKFLASKEFGFTDIMDYKNNSLFGKDNIFYSYDRKYYNYLKNQNYYNLITKLNYEVGMNLYGSRIEEVYGEISSNSESLIRELKDGYDVSNRSLYNYKLNDSVYHTFLFKASKDGNSIYIESDMAPYIYTKRKIEDVLKGDRRLTGAQIKLLTELYKSGYDEVYLSNEKKDVIVENDISTTVYNYKAYNSKYDVRTCNRILIGLSDVNDRSKIKKRLK